MMKMKVKNKFKVFLIVGIAFLAIGISTRDNSYYLTSIVFMFIGAFGYKIKKYIDKDK